MTMCSTVIVTFCFSIRGTPLPNRKGTYDLSSSVMYSNAPPLRPDRGKVGDVGDVNQVIEDEKRTSAMQ